jgi:hypothetical protein
VPISLPTELEATRDLQELKSFAAPMKGNDGSSLGDLEDRDGSSEIGPKTHRYRES